MPAQHIQHYRKSAPMCWNRQAQDDSRCGTERTTGQQAGPGGIAVGEGALHPWEFRKAQKSQLGLCLGPSGNPVTQPGLIYSSEWPLPAPVDRQPGLSHLCFLTREREGFKSRHRHEIEFPGHSAKRGKIAERP